MFFVSRGVVMSFTRGPILLLMLACKTIIVALYSPLGPIWVLVFLFCMLYLTWQGDFTTCSSYFNSSSSSLLEFTPFSSSTSSSSCFPLSFSSSLLDIYCHFVVPLVRSPIISKSFSCTLIKLNIVNSSDFFKALNLVMGKC